MTDPAEIANGPTAPPTEAHKRARSIGSRVMSDLIEAMALEIWNGNFHPDDVADGTAERCRKAWPREWDKALHQATAALAALRETHHLVPKDQEPVGWLYQWQDNEPVYMPQKRDWADYPNNAGWTETPLYALEKG